MKIALASDLHLEFQTITLPNTEGAKVLTPIFSYKELRQLKFLDI